MLQREREQEQAVRCCKAMCMLYAVLLLSQCPVARLCPRLCGRCPVVRVTPRGGPLTREGRKTRDKTAKGIKKRDLVVVVVVVDDDESGYKGGTERDE